MNSKKPYLLSAFYGWICDNNLTPYILVDVSDVDFNLPFDDLEDNKIVLNISPSAVADLDLSNDFINFKARFEGMNMNVCFPVDAVLAIYAKENGQGMFFQEEGMENKIDLGPVSNIELDENEVKKEDKKKKGSHLKVIK